MASPARHKGKPWASNWRSPPPRLVKRNSGEGGFDGFSVPVKVLVDVEGVESSIESAVSGAETEAMLGICHQRMEIGHIGLIEGQGQFGKYRQRCHPPRRSYRHHPRLWKDRA